MPGQAELGMTLEQRLRLMTDALPDAASVILPVTLIRGWLTDDTLPPAGRRADLTVPEVAALFNRSPQTVRSWIRNKALDAYRLHGREYRITPRALEAFQQQQLAGAVCLRCLRAPQVPERPLWRPGGPPGAPNHEACSSPRGLPPQARPDDAGQRRLLVVPPRSDPTADDHDQSNHGQDSAESSALTDTGAGVRCTCVADGHD